MRSRRATKRRRQTSTKHAGVVGPCVVALSVVVLCTLMLSSHSWAGGMEMGDNGAEAMGRGGAFAVKADNGAAINYNPAGYAKLKGHHITVAFNVLRHSYSFLRNGPYLRVDTNRPVFFAPTHLFFNTDFGWGKGFVVGIGLYTPPSVGRDYPEFIGAKGASQLFHAPQRYDTAVTSGLVLFPSVVVSYQIFPWLLVGASFQIWMLSTESKTIATVAAACQTPEDPNCDVHVDLKAADWFSPIASFGIILRPHRMFELGFMLRTPSEANAKGQAKVSFGPSVAQLEASMRFPLLTPREPKATLKMTNPLMLRAGARLVFFRGKEEAGDIEFNFNYENWKSATSRSVTLEATSLNEPMAPTAIDWGMIDTFAFRLGGAYNLVPRGDWRWTFRAGMSGETATAPVSETRLAVFGASRFALSAGIGVRWRWFKLDFAYTHVFFARRVVNNSRVTASDFGSENPGPTVGNGVFNASADIFSIQTGLVFGDS